MCVSQNGYGSSSASSSSSSSSSSSPSPSSSPWFLQYFGKKKGELSWKRAHTSCALGCNLIAFSLALPFVLSYNVSFSFFSSAFGMGCFYRLQCVGGSINNRISYVVSPMRTPQPCSRLLCSGNGRLSIRLPGKMSGSRVVDPVLGLVFVFVLVVVIIIIIISVVIVVVFAIS